MPDDSSPAQALPARPAASTAPHTRRRIDSRELLGGDRELLIQHQQQVYRLRVTAQGKLILTK